MLTACGSGGGGSSPVPTTQQSSKTAPVSIKLTFNNRTGNSLRGRKYVSRSTQGIGIAFEANAGGANLPQGESAMRTPSFTAQVGSAVATNNTTCTTASPTDGSFSCTFLVAMPVGYDNIQITTWDQAPAVSGYGGSFAASANDLSTNQFTNQLILQNQSNALNFTLLGVVASVNLSLSQSTLVDGAQLGQTATELLSLSAATNAGDTSFPVNTTAGLTPGQNVTIGTGGSAETLTVASANATSFSSTTASTQPHTNGDQVSVTGILNPASLSLNVLAKDADGNVIIGNDQYVDADGNAVTINVSAGPASYPIPSVGSSGTVAITGATSFTTPTVQSTALSYDGGDISSIGFSASLSGTLLTIPTTSATLNFTRTLDGPIHVGGSNLQIKEFPISAVPAGTEYVQYTWTDASGETLPSAEATYNVPSTDNVVDVHISEAPPSGATGFNVYAATASGQEKLVNAHPVPIDASMDYHMIADGSGAAPPVANTNGLADPAGVANGSAVPPAGTAPNDIAAGPDGNLWVADNDGFVGVYSGSTGAPVASYATSSYATAICADSVGSVVVFAYGDQSFHRITTSGTVSTIGALSGPTGYIEKCTTGPDGAVWFVDRINAVVGSVSSYGNIQTWALPNADYPADIAVGPDGRLWVGGDTYIRAVTTAGAITQYGPPGAFDLVADPKGSNKLYFTDVNSSIGEITTAGAMSFDPLPIDGPAYGLAAGPDGNLYTGAANGANTVDAIGRINFATTSVSNPSGIVYTPFTQGLTLGSQPPRQIVAGPDNHSMWFTEYSNAQIGELVLP